MATKFITISIDIMHDKNLNQSQKFILAEIEQLCSFDHGCFASNKHFSDLIGITKENVSRNIKLLEDMGYIKSEIVNGSRNHSRNITLTKIVRPPYQNSKTPLLKQQETKGNIQFNKTTIERSVFSDSEFLSLLAYRKKIKKPLLTDEAVTGLSNSFKECYDAGYTFKHLFDIMQEKQWQSIKLEWVKKEINIKNDKMSLMNQWG